jgi:hypothetical protein
LSRASFRNANIACVLWVDRKGLWLHNERRRTYSNRV